MSVAKLLHSAHRIPYSHKNGIRTILFQTPYILELFHTAFRLYRFDEQTPVCEVVFPELGLMEIWTSFFDYEHHQIVVEGHLVGGDFFRYVIRPALDGIYLVSQKQPLLLQIGSSIQTLPVNTPFVLEQSAQISSALPLPFLSLGCNKSPSIDRMRENPTMEEILPLLYAQGVTVDGFRSILKSIGRESLLGRVVNAVESSRSQEVLQLMRQFWTVAIDGNCVPKRRDDQFFGYNGPLLPDDLLLTEVLSLISCVIRSMFIQEKSDGIYLLPCLPKEFLSGRLIEESLQAGHRICFEWRRGVVRRILLDARIDDRIQLHTGASSCFLRCCTLQHKKHEQNLANRIEIKAGYRYLLDNFGYT